MYLRRVMRSRGIGGRARVTAVFLATAAFLVDPLASGGGLGEAPKSVSFRSSGGKLALAVRNAVGMAPDAAQKWICARGRPQRPRGSNCLCRRVARADRLNDWVPEVRTAALAAARRLFATASTDIVVAAAPYLLSRWSLWQRWEPPAIAEVDALLGQPDVVRQLTSGLMRARNGEAGRQLQHLLRHEWIDGFLVELARGAVQPQVRKVAFQTLLAGEARWRSPHVKRAEELRYAIYKSGLTFEHRPLTVHVDRNVLVEAGLRDRFASVRWLAAGALVESSVQVVREEQAIARLLKDKSRSVRERGQFLARRASVANGD